MVNLWRPFHAKNYTEQWEYMCVLSNSVVERNNPLKVGKNTPAKMNYLKKTVETDEKSIQVISMCVSWC